MEREIETKCIHLEEDESSVQHFGAVSYPIYQTATYAHPAVGQSTGFDYSRLQNPTREHLEKVVASLENGVDASDLSDYADPCGCSKENSGKNGLTDATLRMSVGIENVKDLIAELDQVFCEIENEQ